MTRESSELHELATTPEERRLVDSVRLQLDRSCDALDGATLSRLNRIRHAALERKQRPASRMLLPFGGFVTACVLVVAVSTFLPGTAPEGLAPAAPLEDIDLLTSADSLALYEDYEFYEWLAANDTQVR